MLIWMILFHCFNITCVLFLEKKTWTDIFQESSFFNFYSHIFLRFFLNLRSTKVKQFLGLSLHIGMLVKDYLKFAQVSKPACRTLKNGLNICSDRILDSMGKILDATNFIITYRTAKINKCIKF